jgi:hypothetical protein
MPHISFSELKEWTTCPWKHKLNYIDRINEFKGNEYTAFGTALHSVCEIIVKEYVEKQQNTNLEALFDHEFLKNLHTIKEQKSDIVFNSGLVVSMREQGKYITKFILPALKKQFGKFKLITVEEKLYEPIQDQNENNTDKDKNSENQVENFKGFIDLVIYVPKDKKYHIIDWKTCSWGWDNRKKTDKMITYQLTLYKHFWCKKHNKDYNDVTTYFALLKRTAKKNQVEIFKVSNGAKKINNALKLLNKAVYNIEKHNYVKNRLSCYGKYGICEYYKTKHCM